LRWSEDAKNAFLHARVKQELYIQQPEGFEDPEHPDYVWRLIKSLYGLKQAPYEWNQLLDSHLRANGFKPLEINPCIYIKWQNHKPMIIAVYVDNTIFIADDSNIESFKKVLSKKFAMKDLGKAHYVLGIEIIQDPKTQKIFLHQRHKIEDILKRFKLEDIKPAKTPMEVKLELPVVKQTPSECSSLPYQALVGAFNYLAHATRPDIAYAVNYLSRFNNSYDKRHWNAAKHVLRYLQGTKDCQVPILGWASHPCPKLQALKQIICNN